MRGDIFKILERTKAELDGQVHNRFWLVSRFTIPYYSSLNVDVVSNVETNARSVIHLFL